MRNNCMPSWVEMSLEREPSYFAERRWTGDECTVIAEEDDHLVGMYAATPQQVYLSGVDTSVCYLGALRVERSQRNRIKHIRSGFKSIRELLPACAAAPLWYTVVGEENFPARRLLEAGISGLPKYRQIGRLTTYAIATRRGKRSGLWRRACAADESSIIEFHRSCASKLNLAPQVDDRIVSNLNIESFFLLERGSRLLACCAFWDQSNFRQVVARNYHPAIRIGRPLYNAYAALTARVPLPAIGDRLPQSFLAFAAFAEEATSDNSFVDAAIRDLLSHCPTSVAAIGLHDAHPISASIKKLGPLTYRSRVYSVEFDGESSVGEFPVQPEVALL